ncbi:hypothetical protein NMG60_11018068 [Bertholletia excelsa]
MEDAIVLYPAPAIGHLISTVELGKLIIHQHPSFSIHILVTVSPYGTGSDSTAPYLRCVSATTPAIVFHHLPPVSVPISTTSIHHETLAFQLFHLNNPNLHHSLLSISQNHKIKALIMDFFCYPALSVASALKIQAYFFLTSGACFLAFFLYLPTLHRNTTESFKDIEIHLDVPGLPPIPPKDAVTALQDRNDQAYELFLDAAIQLPKSAGIVVNTFELLESRALKAIREGLCVPDEATPPIHCIGPLIAGNEREGSKGGSRECLTWLDSQPRGSAVFLSFGSMGLLSAKQIKETALGLERSGQRFLWVVRSPPATEEQRRRFVAPPEPDLGELLPEGFLERTRERGLVVRSWAPQPAVLRHDAVGGFVTHCGWNSVLEALCAGIPMAAWPLYSEQRFNKVVMVEQMKIALPMEESDRCGFVSALEVEKRVRQLVDSEEGSAVRTQVLVMKAAAEKAMSKGGSSLAALSKLVDSWARQ